MLEKQDLQAIKELIDTSIAASEQRIKTEVTQSTMVMMEQYFDPKFNLLAERWIRKTVRTVCL